MSDSEIRHDWTREQIHVLFQQSFNELIYLAHTIHRRFFQANAIQISSLLNVKTGLCPEDCAYCPQSGHYNTGLKREPLMALAQVKVAAKTAKEKGAGRFCIAAAWRSPPKKEFKSILAMVAAIKELELEACATLGMLTEEQALQLAEVGLDYYNHNLDTSPEYYPTIISTRTYEERLETLAYVRSAGIKVCCGGIIGMGETQEDRAGLLQQLANLPEHPKSVTLNKLIPIPGTPLADKPAVDAFEFIRMVAVARVMLPSSMLRLSAGRGSLSDEAQALSFFAGANSIHYGEKLLTTENISPEQDRALLKKLGLNAVLVDTELNACH